MSHASPAHDAPLEMLREAPRALLELLEVVGFTFASDAAVELVSAELNQAVPTHRAADLVALVRNGEGAVSLVVIVEVQRRRDVRKRRTWPLYAAQLEARHDAPSVVVVLALESDHVARWARSPESPWPDVPFAPVVLGPEALEHLTNPGLGLAASPELPVLAAMARLSAREKAGTWPPEVRAELTAAVATALASIRAISSAEKQAHLLALLHSVARHAEARAILREQLAEDGMNTLERIKKSARLEGRAEGKAEGKAEGVELGKAQGVALGEARGKADGLLHLLRRRGFDVGPALEMRITSTRDVAQLDRWFDRAIDAATVDAVFGEGQ